MRKPDVRICKNKDADQLSSNCTSDQRICFRCTASTIPLVKSKFQRHSLFSETVQVDLCQTWSETPKTGFHASRLKYVVEPPSGQLQLLGHHHLHPLM